MIEGTAKTIERTTIGIKEKPVTQSETFDPDKRIEAVGKEVAEESHNQFNPDKRIDSHVNNDVGKSQEPHDPKEYIDGYCQDVVNYSEFPETLKGFKLKTSDLRNVSVEEQETLRKEYGNKKETLIKEWEQKYGMEWPRYKEDVYNKNGKLIRRAGERYDAHHKHPLSLGGTNTVDNITPLRADVHYDHQGVHAKGSAYDNMHKAIKGKV